MEPRLLSSLHEALAKLYSLETSPPSSSSVDPRDAHDFLIQLQSRNLRRRLHSFQQKIQDSTAGGPSVMSWTNDQLGSSWLAFLVLLIGQPFQSNHNSHNAVGFAACGTERLFCAQSLLQRLRRTKLVEAIDWEMEQSDENQILAMFSTGSIDNPSQEHFIPAYQHLLSIYNPFVAEVLSMAMPTMTFNVDQHNNITNEDLVKGNLALFTLVAVAFQTAAAASATKTFASTAMIDGTSNQNHNSSSHHHHHHHQTKPLLSTLGFAISTITLRIWFTQKQLLQQLSPGATMTVEPRKCLVEMILDTFQSVLQVARSRSGTNTSEDESLLSLPWLEALHSALGALPDVILGAPGGARGRLSMDPQALYDAGQELRSTKSFDAIMSCWITVEQQQASFSKNDNNNNDDTTLPTIRCHLWTLQMWEQWAKFLPLPMLFLERSLPVLSTSLQTECRSAAVAYLLAIFESATWTEEQVLASTCGMSQSQLPQPAGKKKQTSRSKRRQKEVLQSRTTNQSIQAAKEEVWHRGQVACRAAVGTDEGLHKAFQQAMALTGPATAQLDGMEVQGEGPIGCLAMAASSCLPHLLRSTCLSEQTQQQTTTTTSDEFNLFVSLAQVFQSICASPHRSVRVLSLEPLYALHECLVQIVVAGPSYQQLDASFETAVVEHFFVCCMSLASSCEYPHNYFDNLAASSDEDLELYRNDIRDLLRTVTGSILEDAGNKSDTHGLCQVCSVNPTLVILNKLLSACAAEIQQQQPPETVVHAFSALAKPLNSLAKALTSTDTTARNGTRTSSGDVTTTAAPGLALETLSLALKFIVCTAESIVDAFHRNQNKALLLPLSRTLNLAIASFAPMLSALRNISELKETVSQALTRSIQVAILSLRHIPELAASSIKGSVPFEIRGTMRGPGSEDHVGVLALMRLTFESDSLALALATAIVPSIDQLSELYLYLQTSESKEHGATTIGTTTPKSRRILLSALCHLELVSQGTLGASEMLTGLFHSAVESISAMNLQQQECGGELCYYRLCESAFDLAAFSPSIVHTLFEQTDDLVRTKCLETLTSAVLDGYKLAASDWQSNANATILQWNRLRAALFALIKSSANPDLPQRSIEMIQVLVVSECQIISDSLVAARPHVIGADGVPAGLFIRSVSDAIEAIDVSGRPASTSSSLSNGALQEAHTLGVQLSNSISALYRCRDPVLSVSLLETPAPDDDFVDPRCTMLEAWLVAMNNLVKLYKLRKGIGSNDDAKAEQILVESFVAGVVLLFYPTLNKMRQKDPGMSLDGPHSLALLSFFTSYLELGSSLGLFERAAVQLASRMPATTMGVGSHSYNHPITHAPTRVGFALIGASFFRAVQGGLPPWAVESVPNIFRALFLGMDCCSSTFALVLRDAMEIRLSTTANQQFGISPGQLISGPFFESISFSAKEQFLREVVELSQTANWRKLKQSIKAVCGGKKKDAGFQQKPAYTRWEFDRI